MKKAFYTIILGLWLIIGCQVSGFSQSTTGGNATSSSTNPGNSTTISTATAMGIIKLAAYKMKLSVDVMWAEYQTGNCCIHLLDAKGGVYLVEYAVGGGTTLAIEVIF